MIPDRYNISNLRSAASDSQVVIEEAQRLRRSTIKILGSLKFKMKHREPGENFIKKDWDNMIILDACRYDAFGDYL
jgi:hypothetical protein